MRFTTGFIFIFALTLQLRAVQYEGPIASHRAGNVKIVETKLKKLFLLTYKNASVQKAVSMLKTNDFISFEGTKNLTKSYLHVDSINYVGLSELLGTWTGDDNYCYRFTTYTELKIYPKSTACHKKMIAPREFAYTINADEDNWFMLVSDSTARYAADLKFITKKHIEISLYDVDNGNILRLIQLTK